MEQTHIYRRWRGTEWGWGTKKPQEGVAFSYLDTEENEVFF